MLWSYWHHRKGHGIAVPHRFNVFRTRQAAFDAAYGRPGRTRQFRVVALILREQVQPVQTKRRVDEIVSVVPEFNVAAVGSLFSLPARRDGDHLVVSGEVPAALWYDDTDQ